MVQPDISVICDTTKLTEAGCTGAPDWIIDPGNRYIHIYLLGENDRYPEEPIVLEGRGTAESSVLQGFGIDLEELFRFD